MNRHNLLYIYNNILYIYIYSIILHYIEYIIIYLRIYVYAHSQNTRITPTLSMHVNVVVTIDCKVYMMSLVFTTWNRLFK